MASRYTLEDSVHESPDGDPIVLSYYYSTPGRSLTSRMFRRTERWDVLATDTQRDSTMWWIIADLNPHTMFDPFNRPDAPVYIPGITEGV